MDISRNARRQDYYKEGFGDETLGTSDGDNMLGGSRRAHAHTGTPVASFACSR